MVTIQSLLDRANNADNSLPSDIRYWKYDWYSPLKVSLEQQIHGDMNGTGNSLSNAIQENYPFKYKAWISVGDKKLRSTTGTEDQFFNLDDYDRTKEGWSAFGKYIPKEGKNGSLTAEDIRGAVGDTESIPGLSSSVAYTTDKTKDNVAEEPLNKTAESSQ